MVGLEKGITKEAVRMAWPAVCESFFIALAGMVDSLMVSSMGASAVAAVGLTTQPKFMGLALFFAMNVSVSALVARRRGEKNQRSANQILLVAILFVIVATVVISSACVMWANEIINFCGSAPETHEPVSYTHLTCTYSLSPCLSQTKSISLSPVLPKMCIRDSLTAMINMIEEQVNAADYTAMDIAAAFLKMYLGQNDANEEESSGNGDFDFENTGAEEGMVRLFINKMCIRDSLWTRPMYCLPSDCLMKSHMVP